MVIFYFNWHEAMCSYHVNFRIAQEGSNPQQERLLRDILSVVYYPVVDNILIGLEE